MSPVLATLLACALLLVSCGGARSVPGDAQRSVVSLARVDCAECGDSIASQLKSRPGVYEAKYDRRRAELAVSASPSFDVIGAVKELAAAEGFEAELGAGKGKYLDWAGFAEGADVKLVIADGSDVPDLKSVLAAGKVTVVDFSAIWCKPCRTLDEHMASVLRGRQDVAYRKLDIGDWGSPLADRYLKDIAKLPYVLVYDARGERVAEIVGLDLDGVDSAIAKAAAP